MRRLLSIVSPCYNEELNVEELASRVRATMAKFPDYDYEHIFIDNASRDHTVAVLKQIAAEDGNVRIIVNARNFGHLRSPMHAMLQSSGDACVLLFSDLQDPPELIENFIAEWEKGIPIVLAIKNTSEESRLMYWCRTRYYKLLTRLASLEIHQHFTGFGLFDRSVMEIVRSFGDQYPYFRGMISEIGLPHVKVFYNQKARKRGFTKNNFYTLYDLAILGLTNVSKVPLRLFTFFGFACSALSILFALGYLVYKIFFWNSFEVGIAPVVIGLFFLGSVQLAFIGVLSEYIAAIHTQVLKRPLVVERERVNFEPRAVKPAPLTSAAGHFTN
jgi:glycosyltransferase involved in cell wall biosynthesis